MRLPLRLLMGKHGGKEGAQKGQVYQGTSDASRRLQAGHDVRLHNVTRRCYYKFLVLGMDCLQVQDCH